MRAILHLCREYGQSPEWWGALPREDRAMLLADLRLRDREVRRASERVRRG